MITAMIGLMYFRLALVVGACQSVSLIVAVLFTALQSVTAAYHQLQTELLN
jgi:multidrug efflux pump subunit AcrB